MIILLWNVLNLRLPSFCILAKRYKTLAVRLLEKYSKSLVHEVISYNCDMFSLMGVVIKGLL
ncbi:MAG TPA: hypothetical protein DDW91_00880 [Shewanella frigidimarina]|nr:hypothetical protein [Shewanella frigidimarina]|tara:strand:- start:1172 stop:1357 length:186 start_codon:yes stop_codon:yes gene_type:complete